MKNEIGNKYGKLTVLTKAEKPEGRPKGAYWLCQCECGNQKIIRGADLRAGNVNSCGCLYGKHTIKNEIGNRYGKLIVIAQAKERKRNAIQWICKCDCGNEVIVRGADLRAGDVKSCGCLVKERSREVNYKDLTNQRFGKLIALEIDEEKSKLNKLLYWKCKCDCGNFKSILSQNLINGSTKSCGCIKISSGEERIMSLLQERNINFEKEYTFIDLLSNNSTVRLRFDFAIFSNSGKLIQLIEYDGIQHYKPIERFGGEKAFLQIQINDRKKDLYCLENNIKLIRIPYTCLDIDFQDLEIDINELSQ